MGEKSKTIGEMGEDYKEKFFSKIGWTHVSDSIDIPYKTEKLKTDGGGKPKTSHGIDAVYSYFDVYKRKCIYVVVSAKASTWLQTNKNPKTVSTLAKKVGDWIQELNAKVTFAGLSQEFHEMLGIDPSSNFEFVGLLFYYSYEGFKDDTYSRVLSSVPIKRSFDFRETIYVVSNREIEKISSVINHLQNKGASEPFKYYYPNLDLYSPESSWGFAPTLEQLFSSMLVTRINEQTIVSYFGETDADSIQMLLATLGHFQIFREDSLEIAIYSNQSFDEPSIKRKIEDSQIIFGENVSSAKVVGIDRVTPRFEVR